MGRKKEVNKRKMKLEGRKEEVLAKAFPSLLDGGVWVSLSLYTKHWLKLIQSCSFLGTLGSSHLKESPLAKSPI